MAGDWLKIEKITPEKPEILRMASLLKRDSDEIFGKLFRIWAWADDQSVDGSAMKISEDFIDKKAGKKGFAEAMRAVGWLKGVNESLTFPGFYRHNGDTAKGRAETNRRVAKHRSGNKENVSFVTGNALQKPLPEKRREENNVVINNNVGTEAPAGELALGQDLWAIVQGYPKRQGDREALEHLQRSIKAGADPTTILAGTRAIAAVIPMIPSGHLNAYVCSAATFFKNERWRDDPQTWVRNAGRNGGSLGKLDLGGRRVGEIIRPGAITPDETDGGKF